MLACGPGRNDAPARDVIKATMEGITQMRSGSGGKLVAAAERLINGLRAYRDPVSLVETTRKTFPSVTIETDRRHPTYVGRCPGKTRG